MSSYRSYTGWQKHIKNKHKTANNDITYNDGAGFEETEIDDVYLQEATAELNSENDKKREIAKWVLHLRDENKLTQSTTENILSNITTLCSQLVDEIKQRIREQLSDGQVTGDTVTKVLETLERDDFKQPFKGLETKHQQLSFLQHLCCKYQLCNGRNIIIGIIISLSEQYCSGYHYNSQKDKIIISDELSNIFFQNLLK